MDVRHAQLFVFEYMLRNVRTEAARLMCALYAEQHVLADGKSLLVENAKPQANTPRFGR